MDTLDDVSDASKYTGSMYKEFMLKCETSESVLEMLSNAWRAVRIEVGNNFLPILKDVAGFGLDKLNDFRAALPDITARVKEVIEYLLNNGDKVAATIGGIGAAWAGMRFAPQILQVVSGVTKGVSGTATGGGKIFNGIRTIASGMSYGAQMAGIQPPSIGPQPQNSFLKNIATKANGAGVGLWATLKNFTGLTKNDGKTKIDFVRDVMGASERGQTIRQRFPYINGVMSAASDFGKTKIASGIGGVTKQIFTGIIGPNGIDVAKLAGGLKNFGGATAAVFGAMPGNAAKAGVNFLSKMNFANGTGLGRTIYRMANSTQGLSGKAALAQMGYIFNQTRPGQVLSGATGFVKNAAPAVADFGGKAFGLGKAVASPS